VARRDAAAVAAGLRKIYTAPGEDAALDALGSLAAGLEVPAGGQGLIGRPGGLHPIPGLQPAGEKTALHRQQH